MRCSDCNISHPDAGKSLKCSVCASKVKPLFSMPKNKDLKKKWEDNLQIKVLHSSKLRVCRIHFEDKCWGNSNLKLKLNAVPTKFLGKFPLSQPTIPTSIINKHFR